MIVESPTKAKTIGKYLGAGYDVRATVGHLRDLPDPRARASTSSATSSPSTSPSRARPRRWPSSRRRPRRPPPSTSPPTRTARARPSPGTWPTSSASSAPTHRVLFHEITKDAIHEAMEHPGEIDDRKVNAQQARRILDRLVGYKASPILWRSIKTGLSAGRVQTVALRLIVEREREIRAFTPQEYWSIEALLAKDGQTFEAVARQGGRPQAAAPLGRGRAGGGGRGAADRRSSSPRSRSATGGRTRPRRSPPARCSRRPPRSSASARGAPCARRRTCTRAGTWARTVRSASSPTCGPTRCACRTRPSPRCGTSSARATPSRTCRPRPTPTARKKNARVQDAHEAVRPTDVTPPAGAGPGASSSPTSSGSTSSSGSGSWRRR